MCVVAKIVAGLSLMFSLWQNFTKNTIFRVATHLENLGNLEKSEFKSGQEKTKSQGKCVLAYGQLPWVLILTQNVQKGIIY